MSSEDKVKPYHQLWLPTIALGAALALASCGLAAETQFDGQIIYPPR
jgi:hypothetical protein